MQHPIALTSLKGIKTYLDSCTQKNTSPFFDLQHDVFVLLIHVFLGMRLRSVDIWLVWKNGLFDWRARWRHMKRHNKKLQSQVFSRSSSTLLDCWTTTARTEIAHFQPHHLFSLFFHIHRSLRSSMEAVTTWSTHPWLKGSNTNLQQHNERFINLN